MKLPDFSVDEVFTGLTQSYDWGLKYANIPETWKVTQGEGITIAVIDTGMPDHLDIGDNAIEGKNLVKGEPLKDENGHQTHCVGIISAKNNEKGFVGVAPKSKCICIKALGKNGSGRLLDIVMALDYVQKIKPDIVSMSLGSASGNILIQKEIQKLYAMNIPVVCAAGNSGKAGVNYPAAFPETIAVGAFDKNGNIASFSSRGPEVDWAAPGAKILSTFLNNGYASLSGTSMACPFMVGVIALMLAKHRKQEKETGKNDCKTIEDIRHHLLKYTNDKGTVGKDNDWGYGIVDAEKLITDKDAIDPDVPKPEPITTTPAPTKPKQPESKKRKTVLVICAVIALAVAGFTGVNLVSCEKTAEVDWDERYQNDPNKVK